MKHLVCFLDPSCPKSGFPLGLGRFFPGGARVVGSTRVLESPSLCTIGTEDEARTTTPRNSREITTRPAPSEGGTMATPSRGIPAPPLSQYTAILTTRKARMPACSSRQNEQFKMYGKQQVEVPDLASNPNISTFLSKSYGDVPVI